MKLHTIGLDYDGTFTLHPEAWEKAIDAWKLGNMFPIFVTMRFKNEPLITTSDIPIIYTGRMSKISYCLHRGLRFSVWVDDSPHFLYQDAYEEDPITVGRNKWHDNEYEKLRTTKDEIDEILHNLKSFGVN